MVSFRDFREVVVFTRVLTTFLMHITVEAIFVWSRFFCNPFSGMTEFNSLDFETLTLVKCFAHVDV